MHANILEGGSKTLSLKRHPTMCERDMSAQLAFFSPQASPVQLQFLVRRKTFPKNTLREYVGEDISQEGTTVSQQAREYNKKSPDFSFLSWERRSGDIPTNSSLCPTLSTSSPDPILVPPQESGEKKTFLSPFLLLASALFQACLEWRRREEEEKKRRTFAHSFFYSSPWKEEEWGKLN